MPIIATEVFKQRPGVRLPAGVGQIALLVTLGLVAQDA